MILVATVTSLPELVTGIFPVTLAKAPDIAVGDVLGSCVFNLLLNALLDFVYRETSIFSKASQAHILSAGFSITLIGLVAFSCCPAILRRCGSATCRRHCHTVCGRATG